MRLVFLAAAAAVVCGCGSTVDSAPAFVGTWTGTLTLTANGVVQDTEDDVSLPISTTGANALLLNEFCPDGSALAANVTSATEFQAGAACPAIAISNCSSVIFTYSSVVGTLSGTTNLAINGVVTGVGCGVTAASNFSFTSSSKT
jgi:hypothetical protein